MLDQERVDVCCRLLNLMPGVTVEKSSFRPSGYAYFILRIEEAGSLGHLTYMACDSVLKVEVWPVSFLGLPPTNDTPVRSRDDPDWGAPDYVRYILRSPDGDREPEFRVTKLCVHLVDTLTDKGFFDPIERESLRSQWGW